MLRSTEHQVFVRLIADDEKVVVDRNPRDRFQLVPRQHHPRWVVGRIDDDHPGARCDRLREGAFIQGESVTRSRLWNGQRNGNSGSSGHSDDRGVEIEVGLKHDHFVTGLDEGQHRGGQCLACTRGHHDAGVGRNRQSVMPLLVLGDR